MTIPNAAPADRPAEQRLDLIDALRGFALAGVLLSNLRDFSLYTLIEADAPALWPGERWLQMALAALLDAKAMLSAGFFRSRVIDNCTGLAYFFAQSNVSRVVGANGNPIVLPKPTRTCPL